MSKGYPSLGRARRAYWRGARDARQKGASNPYDNDKLRDLWTRGLDRARAAPNLVIPLEYLPKRQREVKANPLRPCGRPTGDDRPDRRGGGRPRR